MVVMKGYVKDELRVPLMVDRKAFAMVFSSG